MKRKRNTDGTFSTPRQRVDGKPVGGVAQARATNEGPQNEPGAGISSLVKQLECERRLRLNERTHLVATVAASLLPKIHEGLSPEDRREVMPSIVEDAEFLIEAARLRCGGLWAHQLFEGQEMDMLTASQIAKVFKVQNWRGWKEDNTVRGRLNSFVDHFREFGHNPFEGRAIFRALGIHSFRFDPTQWIKKEPAPKSRHAETTKYAAYTILRAVYLVGTDEQKILVKKPY